MVNYIRFNRIEHKKTFIERMRMCFDKKFALEYQIFQLNSELEYAKQEHQYDTYKELIIELIAIERTRYRFKDIVDIFYNTAKYFKNNHRYDLSVIFYNNLIEEYRTNTVNSNDYSYLGNIHEELGDVFTDLNNYYESINNYVKATNYLYKGNYNFKVNSINLKIAIVKIISYKYLDAIFIFEKLIFENDKYLNKNNNNYYITFIILCYLCLFDTHREPYLQINSIRKTLDNYKKKYIDYCEAVEYLAILNIISSIENLDYEHFTMQAQQIISNITDNWIRMAYTGIFTYIHKYIKNKNELYLTRKMLK